MEYREYTSKVNNPPVMDLLFTVLVLVKRFCRKRIETGGLTVLIWVLALGGGQERTTSKHQGRKKEREELVSKD